MKLLKMPKVSMVDDNLDKAAGRLAYVLKSKPSNEMRSLYCININVRLEDCESPLS